MDHRSLSTLSVDAICMRGCGWYLVTTIKLYCELVFQVESLVENTIAVVLPTLTRAVLEVLLKKTVQKSIEEFTKKAAKHFGQEILTKLSQTVFRIALIRCIGFVGSQVAWVSLQQNAAVIVQDVVASEANKLCRTGTKAIVKTVGQSLGAKPKSSSPRKRVCRMTKSGVLAGKV